MWPQVHKISYSCWVLHVFSLVLTGREGTQPLYLLSWLEAAEEADLTHNCLSHCVEERRSHWKRSRAVPSWMWLPEQVMDMSSQSSSRAWIDSQAPSCDGLENPEQAESISRALNREQLKCCKSAPFQLCLTLMNGAAMVGWDNGKAEHFQSSWAGSSRKELPSVHGVNRRGGDSSRGSVQSSGHREKTVQSSL